jgi:hypothetical protein
MQLIRPKRDQLTLYGFRSNRKPRWRFTLDKLAPAEMVALRGTSEMKIEFTEEIRRHIVESQAEATD